MSYVTEQILHCIKTNNRFPQEVQISNTMWLNFGRIGLDLCRAYKRTTKFKHLSYWQELSAAEINERLRDIEWETDN